MAEVPQQPGATAEKVKEKAKEKPDRAKEAVLKRLDQKEREATRQIQNAFDRVISVREEEVYIVRARELKEKQVREVTEKYKAARDKIEALAKQGPLDRADLSAEAQRIFDETSESTKKYAEKVIDILKSTVRKGDFLTPEDVVKLGTTLTGMEALTAVEPAIQEVLKKLSQPPGMPHQLEKDDYKIIIQLLNPQELSKEIPEYRKFEASTAGILIGKMAPAERYELMEHLMESEKSHKTAEILNDFLSTGILTVRQGEDLIKKAAEKHLIDPETQIEMEGKLHGGEGSYQQQAEAVKKEIQKEADRLRGHYADNFMNRMVGAPLLGTAMVVHSFFWILVNVLANKGKNLLKNPYILVALGEGAAGLEMASGAMKKGGGWGFDRGWVSETLERWQSPNAPKDVEQRRAVNQLGEIYANNLELGNYLEQGGMTTILELRKEKETQQKQNKTATADLKFDELYEKETSSGQKILLAFAKNNFTEKKLMKDVNQAASACKPLGITPENNKFQDYLNDIKKALGLRNQTTVR